MWWDILEGDGCTFWFDEWRGIALKHCCDAHDTAFATTLDLGAFFRANLELAWCGVTAGAADWAIFALVGVMSPIGMLVYFAGKKRPPRR